MLPEAVLLALAALSCTAQIFDPKYCRRIGTAVTCTYNDSKIRSIFIVPKIYSNMTVELYSGSGGANINLQNETDTASRGQGVHMFLQVRDHLPAGNFFDLQVGENGMDATLNERGSVDRYRNELGGDGGMCASAEFSRFGAAGGSMTTIHVKDSKQVLAKLFVGAGGGAGGVMQNATSWGAPAPIIQHPGIVSPGNAGFPYRFSGKGGSMHSPGKGAGVDPENTFSVNGGDGVRLVRGGHGGSMHEAKYCLSGGGGGTGHLHGGGGAATGGEHIDLVSSFSFAAGGGGSGSSHLTQLRPIFKIVDQRNAYTENVQVIIRYSTEPAPEEIPEDEYWSRLSLQIAAQCAETAARLAAQSNLALSSTAGSVSNAAGSVAGSVQNGAAYVTEQCAIMRKRAF